MESINLSIVPHAEESSSVLNALRSDATAGLTPAEAEHRMRIYGPNAIRAEKSKSILSILLSQFNSPMVWILLFAAGLSFYFREIPDAIAIVTVIIINALIGFYMEFQAARSMNSLKKMAAVPAKILRDGELTEASAEKVVPGDILYIEAGDMVPADGRILRATQLEIDESALTGESLSVSKQLNSLAADTVLAERNNMLFKGTYSVKGNGYMVVTSTGMNTEFGKIARMVQLADQSVTPLEKKLENFTRKLIWLTLILVIVVFIAGLLNGHKLIEMLETSIALAVAAIPEGLPIVATMALANGMIRMARHNVIVKKLSAIETLGGTSVICTDKTGTLTQNKIEVNQVITPAANEQSDIVMNHLAVLCNTSELKNTNGNIVEIGDPLEIGLLKYALGKGLNVQETRKTFVKLAEEPFSSETKVMGTVHQNGDKSTLYAKGAVEELLERCDRILMKDGVVKLDKAGAALWMKKAEGLANSGMKVIAGAYNPDAEKGVVKVDHLVFAGLFVMNDPVTINEFRLADRITKEFRADISGLIAGMEQMSPEEKKFLLEMSREESWTEGIIRIIEHRKRERSGGN